MERFYIDPEEREDIEINIQNNAKFTFVKGTIFQGYNANLKLTSDKNSDVQFIQSEIYCGNTPSDYQLPFIVTYPKSKMTFKSCLFANKITLNENNFTTCLFNGQISIIDCEFLNCPDSNKSKLYFMFQEVN